MTSIELSIIDRATQLQRLSIEEQLSRLRFAETRAELDAHRRIAADLIRALTHLGILPAADECETRATMATPGESGLQGFDGSRLCRPDNNLAAASCGDEMPHRAGQPCKPTAGAVFDLPVNAHPVAMDAEPVAPVSPLNGPQIPVSGVSQHNSNGADKVAGNSINPNADVRQAFPKGRWT